MSSNNNNNKRKLDDDDVPPFLEPEYVHEYHLPIWCKDGKHKNSKGKEVNHVAGEEVDVNDCDVDNPEHYDSKYYDDIQCRQYADPNDEDDIYYDNVDGYEWSDVHQRWISTEWSKKRRCTSPVKQVDGARKAPAATPVATPAATPEEKHVKELVMDMPLFETDMSSKDYVTHLIGYFTQVVVEEPLEVLRDVYRELKLFDHYVQQHILVTLIYAGKVSPDICELCEQAADENTVNVYMVCSDLCKLTQAYAKALDKLEASKVKPLKPAFPIHDIVSVHVTNHKGRMPQGKIIACEAQIVPEDEKVNRADLVHYQVEMLEDIGDMRKGGLYCFREADIGALEPLTAGKADQHCHDPLHVDYFGDTHVWVPSDDFSEVDYVAPPMGPKIKGVWLSRGEYEEAKAKAKLKKALIADLNTDAPIHDGNPLIADNLEYWSKRFDEAGVDYECEWGSKEDLKRAIENNDDIHMTFDPALLKDSH